VNDLSPNGSFQLRILYLSRNVELQQTKLFLVVEDPWHSHFLDSLAESTASSFDCATNCTSLLTWFLYNVSARQLKANLNSSTTTSYHRSELQSRTLKLTLYTIRMSSSQSAPQELSEMRNSQSLETNQPKSQQSMGKTTTRPDYRRAKL
jgi:hypothetical protein